MLLHTINCSPDSQAIEDCCKALSPEDAVVMFGDGVYAGLSGCRACEGLITSGASLYALAPDVAAAGIQSSLDSAVTVIDYTEFVGLSEASSRQIAWY